MTSDLWAAYNHVVLDAGHSGHIDMGLRRIRNHHLMPPVGMLKEIIDPFFFHQAAREIEIGFAVLNAILAVFVLTVELIGTVKPAQYLFQNIRHGLLLKNPAPSLARQKPYLWDNFCIEDRKSFIAVAFRKVRTNSVEIAPIRTPVRPEDGDLQGDFVAHDLAEINGGRILRDECKIKRKQGANVFDTTEPRDQEIVFAQWGGNLQQAIGLSKVRHSLGKKLDQLFKLARLIRK
jgi:hypothetical protein